jgi:hypothetical protein
MDSLISFGSSLVTVVKESGWSYEQLITVLAFMLVGMALLVLLKYKN